MLMSAGSVVEEEKTIEKLHIQSIFQRKAKNDENSTTLTNTLTTYIGTLFEGRHKFIFELLQNADDAGARHIRFVQTRNYLLIRHSGKHFSHNDVEKICDNAQSLYQDKALDSHTIGYKGIGFKALFSISNCIYIISDQYRFRFDKNYFPDVTEGAEVPQSYPWQIIPIWTSLLELPEEIRSSVSASEVNFIITVKTEKIIEDLNFIAKNPEIILFLNHLKGITLDKLDQPQIKIELKKREHASHLLLNERLFKECYIENYVSSVPEIVREKVAQLPDYICPKKIKKTATVTFTFAVSLKQGSITQVEGRLYAYLPTQVTCQLPYWLNADFLLNADRTQLLNNAWNEFLLQEMAALQFQLLATLAKQSVFRQSMLLALGPSHIRLPEDPLNQAYARGFQRELLSVAFLPTFLDPDRLLKLGDALYDPWNIAALSIPLPKHMLMDLAHVQTLFPLGLKKISFMQLTTYLSKQLTADHNPSFHHKILTFLFQLTETTRYRAEGFDMMRTLGEAPILLSEQGALEKPTKLYFYEGERFQLPTLFAITIPFIHPDISRLCSEVLCQWFKNLGVRIASNADFVKTHIKNMIETKKITRENVIEITRFIFQCFRKADIDSSDLKNLGVLPILLLNDQLMDPRKSYFSAIYYPKHALNDLEATISPADQIFVSDRYIENEEDILIWKKFFLLIGVQQEIKIRKESSYNLYYLVDEYGVAGKEYSNEIRRLGAHGSTLSSVVMVSFPELLKYKAYASYIWQLFTDEAHWPIIKAGCMGVSCRSNKYNVSVPSFLQFYLQHFPCVMGHSPSGERIYGSTSQFYYFSDSLNPSLRNILPMPDDALKLTEEQAVFFGFSTKLNLETCFLLLEKMDSENQGALKTAQQDILYQIICQSLLALKKNLTSQQQELLIKWQGRLPAQNKKFQQRGSLCCFICESLPVFPINSHFLRQPSALDTHEMQALASLFSLEIIKDENLLPLYVDLENDLHLMHLLKEKLPLLVLFEAYYRSETIDIVLERLFKLLQPLQIIRAQKLLLQYSERFPPLELKTHRENNCIFYRAKGSLPANMNELFSIIGEYFKLHKTTQCNLSDILEEARCFSEKEGLEWLSEQGLEISDYQTACEMLAEISATSGIVETKSKKIKVDAVNISQDIAEEKDLAVMASSSKDNEGFEAKAKKIKVDTVHSSQDIAEEKDLPTAVLAQKDLIAEEITTLLVREAREFIPTCLPQDYTRYAEISIEKFAVKQADLATSSAERIVFEEADFSAEVEVKNLMSPPLRSRGETVSIEPRVQHSQGLSGRSLTAIGFWGESFVYHKLKNDFCQKYRAVATPQESKWGFILKEQVSQYPVVKVIWPSKVHSQAGETSPYPWDIQIIEKDKTSYIEIKSTIASGKTPFELSANEVKMLFHQHPDYRAAYHYAFFRVYGVGSERPRLICLEEPAEKMRAGELLPDGMKFVL